MPDLPVPHQLPEFAQVHVHCIGDAVQSSHPLGPLHMGPEDHPYFSVSLIHLELLNAHLDHNSVWDKGVKREPSGERKCPTWTSGPGVGQSPAWVLSALSSSQGQGLERTKSLTGFSRVDALQVYPS